MKYSFDLQLAIQFGVDEAIILNNICFWIEKNKANEMHFHDGRYWTYNSIKAFNELFPYWSTRQIERILKSLESQGAILTANYNKNGYDKTKWYAVSDEVFSFHANREYDSTKKFKGGTQNVKPIPDINTNINTDVNTDINNYDNFSNSDLQSSETKDVENIAYNIHPKKNKEEEEKRPSGGAAEEQFEKFWNKYPVKTSKSECKKKFLKLLEKDRLEILENIDMYVAYKPFLSYRHPNPTTFINQRRWEDEDYKTRGNGTVYKNQMDDISALFD
jgi:hypothetical protein